MSIPWTRRDLLRLGMTAGIALPLGIGRSMAAETPSSGASYLDAALQAADSPF